MRRRPAPTRGLGRFRRYRRRGQVAPVATLLGLLLVITFIANYIATVVPAQMAVNDETHTVQVQDGFGLLATLAREAATRGAIGLQVAQPIALSSAGDPPFAGADQGRFASIATGSFEDVSFTVTGPFTPPYGGIPNTGNSGGCGTTKSGNQTIDISCTGSTNVSWNFSGNNETFIVSGNGGLITHVNFTTSNSIISVGQVGGSLNAVQLVGNQNQLYVNATGGTTVTVVAVGNNNTITLGAKGGAGYQIFLVGNGNTISASMTGGGAIRLVGYGEHDAYSDSFSTGTAVVYYNGFNLTNPTSSACPYSNLANTDTVAGSPGTVTYNETNYIHANGTGNASGWTYFYNDLPRSRTACPFVQGASPIEGVLGASLAVELLNSYAPQGVVAYDEGAVVLAQPGDRPTFLDPPPIRVNGTSLSFWIPTFTSVPATSIGNTGTAVVVFRLVSVQQQTWPSGPIKFPPGSLVNMTVVSPFFAAWVAYFGSLGLSPTCALVPSNAACPTTFAIGVQGSVHVAIPVTAIHLLVGLFSVQLT